MLLLRFPSAFFSYLTSWLSGDSYMSSDGNLQQAGLAFKASRCVADYLNPSSDCKNCFTPSGPVSRNSTVSPGPAISSSKVKNGQQRLSRVIHSATAVMAEDSSESRNSYPSLSSLIPLTYLLSCSLNRLCRSRSVAFSA